MLNVDNGKEGILAASKYQPDIILCDILMPQTDGYTVLKDVKAHSSTAYIPFIYITANVEKSEVKLAMDLGASGYVRKPFDVKELMAVINRELEK